MNKTGQQKKTEKNYEANHDEAIRVATMHLGALACLAHEEAKANGWWENGDRNFGELCMLMVTEISEAFEYHRKGGGKDDHLPEREGSDVEMADVIIRVLDYCGRNQIDIGTIVREKLMYNRTRGYRHGGKKA